MSRRHIGLLVSQIFLLAILFGGQPTAGAVPVTGAGDFEARADAVSRHSLPSLHEFAASVEEQRGESVVGVYVPGVLALRVLQQPAGNAGYVTSAPDAVSQFGMAESYSTVGLLAHNHLTGAQFFSLEAGQTVIVLHADGSRERYRVDTIHRYQALSPTSAVSDFLELGDEGRRISAMQLFSKMYAAGDQLVFQTCIDRDGNPYWGRLFVVATPIETTPHAVLPAELRFLPFTGAPTSF